MFAVGVFAVGLSAAARDVVRLPVPYMRQPDGSTCLPTSLCMAMHFMGRCDLTSATIFKMHRVCRTDRYNVPELVREYDLYAFPSWLEHSWTRETIEAELRCGRPVVLGVDVSRAGHFVLAVGYTDDGRVIIHDPANPHPGWSFDGAFTTTDWERLIWRNGIMLRAEPFPTPPRSISGTLVDTTVPRTMVRGETAVAEFAIKNNGTEPWPEGVHLAAVDAYSSPTRERASAFAILPPDSNPTSRTWISASHAATPDIDRLPPGEVARFRVPLRAPSGQSDDRSQVFRENFNLIDAQGHWFSEHWQTGPGNRQIFFRAAVVAPRPADYALPLIETVAGGRPALAWKQKNGGPDLLAVAENAPAFPSADAGTTSCIEISGGAPLRDDDTSPTGIGVNPRPLSALADVVPTTASLRASLAKPVSPPLRLRPASGQDYEVAYVGDPLGTDYRVEAWVYCELRPDEKGRKFERAGIFMRDSGQHRITSKTETENGECLLMACDSDDGRIRAGNFLHGGIADAYHRSTRIRVTESGWHRFAIRAEGEEVVYELDGAQIAVSRGLGRGRRGSSSRDTGPHSALRSGDCGVFCYCPSRIPNDERRGLLFSGFRIDP